MFYVSIGLPNLPTDSRPIYAPKNIFRARPLVTSCVVYQWPYFILIQMRICSFSDKISISGWYNRLQAHLKKLNPVMHFIPCRAHNLNLVGVNAIELNSKEVGESINAFCSASTSRWGKVVRNTKVKSTLKSLSSTRWSCRYDWTKALWENYTVIKEAFLPFQIQKPKNVKPNRKLTVFV